MGGTATLGTKKAVRWKHPTAFRIQLDFKEMNYRLGKN